MSSSDAEPLVEAPPIIQPVGSGAIPQIDKLQKEKLLVIQWEHLNLYKFYPLALASSWTIRCLLYPMSVVKSRLQLQRQNNVYRGMRHAFVEIVRTEGVSALYRGFWMTLPQLSASFLYSSTYERVRDLLQVHIGIKNHSVVSALAGGIASPCAQLIFVPTDIVAQHMMVHNNPEAFGGGSKNVTVADAIRKDGLEGKRTLGLRVIRAVYKVDGLKGFYRGFMSAIMLYMPSTMVFWSTYYYSLSVFRKIRTKVTELEMGHKPLTASEVDDRNLFLDQAVSGSVAGVASAMVTNPLEMLRIRLQVHRTTYRETVSRLFKYEGTNVFTKGLAPRMLNNALYSCLVMLAYESVKRFSVLPEFKQKVVCQMSVGKRAVSRFDRVNQWLQFARQWHVIDANQQDARKIGEKVARHLAGRHKPIWHPETDCGDHVVITNCSQVAMHGFDWKHTLYHFNKEYPRSKADIPAWQIHEYDPCRIVFLAVYKALGNSILRRRQVQRLHLFPDEDMPKFVQKNIANQLAPVQEIVRRSDQYTAEERAAFPRIVRYPESHVVDWERSFSNPGRHVKLAPGQKAESKK
ncbi:unnamed protein product [Caenorhabditis auriculariae]|uniref:Mitochondrial carrier protein n=1 Tax=Caenorhabditis auriculariae TaxID=2777116 RepID=A0A8S1HM45_9PELO|nr:unnamed protein product [Caenorhabditis auriculariae]